MGYPSYLNKFFNRVKLVIEHYGIDHNDDITYLTSERQMWTYSITAKFGTIYVQVDTQMMYGTIHFDKIFKSVDHCMAYDDFILKYPLLKKQFESFFKDKDIFTAAVVELSVDSYNRKTYGYLLDMLDASLIVKVSEDDDFIDDDSFVIRYNKSMMWTKIRMLDKADCIVFEKTYNFNYLDGRIVYDGDYKQFHQSIIKAYHLNDLDLAFTEFKDLAQLTLMKIY